MAVAPCVVSANDQSFPVVRVNYLNECISLVKDTVIGRLECAEFLQDAKFDSLEECSSANCFLEHNSQTMPS